MLSQKIPDGKCFRLDVQREGNWREVAFYLSSAWAAARIRRDPTKKYRIVKLDQHTGEELAVNEVDVQQALF